MKNSKHINIPITWEVSMKYLLVVIETHANKSFLKQDSDGVSPRDNVRDLLQNCGQVADLYVDHTKKSEVELPEGSDICNDCEKSQEYGTMKDADMFEFDIYCDDCLPKHTVSEVE